MITPLLSFFALSVTLSAISKVATLRWLKSAGGALSVGFMGAAALALGATFIGETPPPWTFSLICAFGTSLELRRSRRQRPGVRS
jgi:hypothetical protein